ncbi:MAG: 50S ribosomal protein L22 [bacterium]|nr:50S ribosomal protein L22 [bacterium]
MPDRRGSGNGRCTDEGSAVRSTAHARYVRQSPYKVRVVLDQVRGLTAADATVTLRFSNRRAAEPILKCLHSAVANMNSKFELGEDLEELAGEVTVIEAYANEGPTLKRFRPRARGRATRIRKRTCHITIVISDGREGTD